MKLNLFDSHVHTEHSHDGHSSMEEICAQAASRGVMGVAFTDHYECDIPAQRLGVRDTLAELPRFQRQYQGRIRLTRGIELGQGHLYPEVAEEILGSEKFDLVLGSVHTSAPGVDIGEINFNKPEVKVSAILEKYFQDCYEIGRASCRERV